MARRSRLYTITDITTGECILKDGSNVDVNRLIGIPLIKIAQYVSTGYVYLRKYIITADDTPSARKQFPDGEQKEFTEAWAKEWDRVRKNPLLWRTIKPELTGEVK